MSDRLSKYQGKPVVEQCVVSSSQISLLMTGFNSHWVILTYDLTLNNAKLSKYTCYDLLLRYLDILYSCQLLLFKPSLKQVFRILIFKAGKISPLERSVLCHFIILFTSLHNARVAIKIFAIEYSYYIDMFYLFQILNNRLDWFFNRTVLIIQWSLGKHKSPMLLFWPKSSEIDVSGFTTEMEPSCQQSIIFLPCYRNSLAK